MSQHDLYKAPPFFKPSGPFRLSALAERVGVELETAEDPLVHDVAPLNKATSDHLSFLTNSKYKPQLETTQAGVCVVATDMRDKVPPTSLALVVEDPHWAFARIAQLFYPDPIPTGKIAPTATIAVSANLGESVQVAAGAVIGDHVVVGDGTCIGANTVIGEGVRIGSGCRIDANVTISHSLIGDRVSILPGARIGQRGFGFAMSSKGHQKIPQIGRVIIEDDCEIGANTCIDRGAGPDTIIGAGTMLDNLVQIAHNVELGKGCVAASGAGIAGSAKLGNFVAMGGKAAIAGHLTIADGTIVLGNAGVIKNTKPGERLMGTPAIDSRTFFKIQAKLLRMISRKTT